MSTIMFLAVYIALASGVGFGLRAYLKRNNPGSSPSRPTINRIEDKELKRALKWTLGFGAMSGVTVGFIVGQWAQLRLLGGVTVLTQQAIFLVALLAFTVLGNLAANPPLRKGLGGSEAAEPAEPSRAYLTGFAIGRRVAALVSRKDR